MSIEKLAPIALFTYNRLDHSRKTIEALKANELAKETVLYIFSDGAKTEKDQTVVEELRTYFKTIKGFKKVEVIERKQNYGFAKSIIEGVTVTVNKHGKLIVLEDDVVCSPTFLSYMNEALTFYEKEKTVWHISAWTPGINDKRLPEYFFWRTMNCSGGWGTWSDRWQHFDNNIDQTIHSFTAIDKFKFSYAGIANFWRQIIGNKKGRINTWAIFWYATIFKNNGLCLTPKMSFATNIGFDGSGEHTTSKHAYKNERKLNSIGEFNFKNLDLKESSLAIQKAYRFYILEKANKLCRLF